jgi:hypothetical protein
LTGLARAEMLRLPLGEHQLLVGQARLHARRDDCAQLDQYLDDLGLAATHGHCQWRGRVEVVVEIDLGATDPQLAHDLGVPHEAGNGQWQARIALSVVQFDFGAGVERSDDFRQFPRANCFDQVSGLGHDGISMSGVSGDILPAGNCRIRADAGVIVSPGSLMRRLRRS